MAGTCKQSKNAYVHYKKEKESHFYNIVVMESHEDITKLSATELTDFLLSKLGGEVEFPDTIASKFEDNKITGQLFSDTNT